MRIDIPGIAPEIVINHMRPLCVGIVVVLFLLVCGQFADCTAQDQILPVRPEATHFKSSGPITEWERNAPWPSRNQPAASYRDAFCARWDDGCTRCTQEYAFGSGVCTAISDDSSCKPKPIQCTLLLRSADRVCLVADDGCNVNELTSPGRSSADLCRPPGWKLNLTCSSARDTKAALSSRSDETPRSAEADLNGIWNLISPSGKECRVKIYPFYLSGRFVIQLPCPFSVAKLQYEAEEYPGHKIIGLDFAIVGRILRVGDAHEFYEKHEGPNFIGDEIAKIAPSRLVMRFSLADPEQPVGLGRMRDFRLERITTNIDDPRPIAFSVDR